MAALFLVLAIFAYWTIIGWALASYLNGGRRLLQNALLAPIAGASAVMLAIFECYRVGLPVQVCGPGVTIEAGVLAVVAIRRSRVPVPCRRIMPFVAILVVAALLVGYPFLLHSFD